MNAASLIRLRFHLTQVQVLVKIRGWSPSDMKP